MSVNIKDLIVTNAAAILLGLTASFLMLILIGANPAEIFWYAFSGMFSDAYLVGEIFVKTTPLILSALSFAVTFKANLFNIGAQGQFYMGALAAVSVSLALQKNMPTLFILIIVCVSTMLTGGALGGLIGGLKSKFKANEFLISMMSTYVVLAIMNYLLRTFLKETKGEYPQTDAIAKSAWIPVMLKGSRLHFGFVLAVLCAAGIWVLLYKTTLGFRIRAVGSNAKAARMAGERAGTITIVTFFISGALAGLAGFCEVNGVSHMLMQDFDSGIGAAGLGIAILANANPIGIIFASILFAILNVMGNIMGRMPGENIPSSFAELMQGFVMLFVIAAYFFRRQMALRRSKNKLRRGK